MIAFVIDVRTIVDFGKTRDYSQYWLTIIQNINWEGEY